MTRPFIVQLMGTSVAMLMLLLSTGLHAAEDGAKPAEAEYYKLRPDLVANLQSRGRPHFLMLTAQVMSRGSDGIKAAQYHTPALRHQILLLMGDQSANVLKTLEGKKKLQADILAIIQEVLTEETGEPQIEAVYFTDFVIE